MRHTLKIFLVLGAGMICVGSIDGGTPRLSSTVMADTCMVGGVISTNTTWSTAECDTYVVYGNLLVDEGATLTMMPGVVAAFQGGYRLEIRGALDARGTATDSIVFTRWEAGDWDCIKFTNSSIDSACSLSYCRIEYAHYGVDCDSASPTISHSLIRKCDAGIYCEGGSPQILQNTITENGLRQYYAGIYIQGGSPVTFGNMIERNTSHGVFVKPYSGTSVSMTADTIRQTYPYDWTDCGIRLYGYYAAISATIRSCEIYENSEGGIYAWLYRGGNVRVTNSYIHDNTASNGGGIYVQGGNTEEFALIDSNCITGNWATSPGNTAGGIYFDYLDSARVQYNDIVGNSNAAEGVYEVYSGTPDSPDIHGEYNWWGTTDSATISDLIYDHYDNFDLRRFVFAPLTSIEDRDDEEARPSEFSLSDNYPNPFNPETRIGYSIPRACHVTLEIFNVLGQKIRTLVDENQPVGKKEVTWDGKNEKGDQVTSGVYLYKLESENFTQTKKMVLMR